MKNNNLNSNIRKFTPQTRRGVAEVISSLLLVVITVVGAVILTSFLDETFVAGGLSASGGTDTSLKTVRLLAYDTRDGVGLFDYAGLDNEFSADQVLCRSGNVAGCKLADNARPSGNGTEFMIIQIENRSVNPIFLKNIYLDKVSHFWDNSVSSTFDPTAPTSAGGDYPRDGMFSILPPDQPGPTYTQYQSNEIAGGQTVDLLIKLDGTNPDIELSKTIRVELNVGTNTLQDFLIQSGGAQ